MKKNYIILLTAFIAVTLNLKLAVAQATHTGNSRLGGDFLGWNSGTAGALEIHNDFTGINASPINFFTSAVQQATLDINGNFSIGWTNTNFCAVRFPNLTVFTNLNIDLH